MASIAQQQTWTGREPALQLFVPPLECDVSLPRYDKVAKYLSPTHCRLCLKSYESGCLVQHLQECAQCTPEEYRRFVLRRVIAEWPQRIDAQLLRTRLAAFKQELCDENFEERPCAVCCRLKRRCKLFDVIFPAATADTPPHWLPLSHEQWLKYRLTWYETVSDILNIEMYLERFFRTREKLLEAQKEVLAFQEDTKLESTFPSLRAAESWLRRVQTWIGNLRDDLSRDSLPAPGEPGVRWLLYPSDNARVDADTGANYVFFVPKTVCICRCLCSCLVVPSYYCHSNIA